LADHVHIEPSHVLFGNLEMAVYDFNFGQIPQAAWRGGGVFLINLLVVVLLFKEFTITTFDPHHGDTVGSRPRLMYYLLMAMSAITCVVAFEAVGSILVVAMMIIPPAIASQFTNNLRSLLILSLVMAVVCAFAGHVFSLGGLGNLISGGLGFGKVGSTNTAGGISVVGGGLFLLSVLLKKLIFRRSVREVGIDELNS
ncbi:MAG: iron chelate uptake ABC transporter family permease subunit, partial [Verrucomicrobiota bacterium]